MNQTVHIPYGKTHLPCSVPYTGVLTGRWVEKRRRTEVLTRQKTKNIVKILYTIDSTKNVRGKNAESGKKRRIVL